MPCPWLSLNHKFDKSVGLQWSIIRPGFEISGLEVQESGKSGQYQEKYTFSSITRVFVVIVEHVS
jgi:hypothetical protein